MPLFWSKLLIPIGPIVETPCALKVLVTASKVTGCKEGVLVSLNASCARLHFLGMLTLANKFIKRRKVIKLLVSR